MASSDTGSTVKYYPEEELAALVRSLDRPQDQQLFSVDVLITYPSLADQYVRVCPHRCDLTTATRKALDGEYSHDQKLDRLKADVQLMVNNCVRFNGDDHPLSEAAADFEKFAMQKIENYLTGKMGGRRVSSLRLQQQLSQTPPTAAVAAANPASHGRPGQRGTRTAGAREAAPAPAPAASSSLHGRHKELTRADVVALVKSLVRREDAGAFEVDVAEVYPELKANYEKVCPVKMNLSMMRTKAEKGVYNTTLSAVAASVAASLPDVRADIELIVNNCIRFNSQLPDWVRLAELFRTFAHRKVDDLVLRVAPSLRSTQTGAQLYASGTPPAEAASAEGPSSPEVVQVSSGSSGSTVHATNTTTSTATIAATPGVKRPRSQDDETPRKTVQWGQKQFAAVTAEYAGPTVQTVITVAPSVCPTPLQPALEVPERLQRRLIADHVSRDRLRARLTGHSAVFVEVFPPAPAPVAASPPAAAGADTHAQEKEATEEGEKEKETEKTDEGDASPAHDESKEAVTAEGEETEASEKVDATVEKEDPPTATAASQKTKETAPEAAAITATTTGAAVKVLQPPRADWPITLTPDQSAQAVLESFRDAIHTFYASKRHAADFNDPFQYSLQDEALYIKMLDTVEEQLESVFLGVLLYAQEAADVHEWVALAALKKAQGVSAEPSAGPSQGAPKDATEDAVATSVSEVVRWAPTIHYTYLVRFLVQLPQMASLCSATLSSAMTNGTQAPVVKVSREALTMLGRVTRFTAEFLSFIAEYEETLLGSADMAKQLTAPE